MSYGYTSGDAYSRSDYNIDDLTAEKLRELMLEMKFNNRDIYQNTLTGDRMVEQAITTRELKVGSVVADTIDVEELSAIASNIGHIDAGVIEAVEMYGVLIQGSRVVSSDDATGITREIVLDNGILSFHRDEQLVGYFYPTESGDDKGFTIVSNRAYLSIGFDQDGEVSGTSSSVIRVDNNNRNATYAGATGSENGWEGEASLRSAFSNTRGSNALPRIDVYHTGEANTSDIEWSGVSAYIGRDTRMPTDTADDRYEYQIRHFTGEDNGNSDLIFRSRYNVGESRYVTEVADSLRIGYGQAGTGRLRIEYDGSTGDTGFWSLGTDDFWKRRMYFEGRGSNPVVFPFGITPYDIHGDVGFNSNVWMNGNTFYANYIGSNGWSGSTSLHLGTQNEVRVTDTSFWNGGNPTYMPIVASEFNVNSAEESKEDISLLDISAREIIRNTDICKYKRKYPVPPADFRPYSNKQTLDEGDTDVSSNVGSEEIGFVIGKDYKTPMEVLYNGNSKAVNLYSAALLPWKAIQEQDEELQELRERIVQLEGGN